MKQDRNASRKVAAQGEQDNQQPGMVSHSLYTSELDDLLSTHTRRQPVLVHELADITTNVADLLDLVRAIRARGFTVQFH